MVLIIGHINVRSLKPKTCDVNDILQKYSLDVLCIGETWLSKNINDDVLIFPGYTLVRKDRPAHFDRRGGGGVCILMRNNIQANTVALSTGASGSRLESLWEVFSYFGIAEVGSLQGKHVLSQTKLKLNNLFQLVTGHI